jgi:hypothetical protein
MTEKTAHRAVRGTLFACSWGYDQTNVDYYVVTRATPSMAYIAQIKNGDIEGIGQLISENYEVHYPALVKDGSLKPLGRFKIHDSVTDPKSHPSEAQAASKYSLWFAPHSFANAYVWRGEELYSTPFGFGH